MKIVDSGKLHKSTEAINFNKAKDCPHFALDKERTPCLWHKSFCLHPDNPDPKEVGYYKHCTLVWHGQCEKEAR